MKCKKTVKFNEKSGYQPCGQCLHCRINKLRNWTVRLLVEFQYHHNVGSMVTLTYAPEHLPDSDKYPNTGNLTKSDIQKFIKRLRSYLPKGFRISYYCAGEYGEKTQRAHYHILIFGLNPYTLENLVHKTWGLGNIRVDDLNQKESSPKNFIKYNLGYTLKKMTEDKDFPDGRNPEFGMMSKNPAIGYNFTEKLMPALLKNKMYPVRGLNNYQQWFFQEYLENYKPWRGDYQQHGQTLIIDQYLSEKICQLLYSDELEQSALHEQKNPESKSEPYKAFLELKRSDNYQEKHRIMYGNSPEYDTVMLKGEKMERKKRDRDDLRKF